MSYGRNKIKFAIIMAVIFPCLAHLNLHNAGLEFDHYRYILPLFIGGFTGFLIGLMKDRWLKLKRNLEYLVEDRTKVLKHEIEERKRAEKEIVRRSAIIQQERNMFVSGPVVVFKWRNAEGWPVEYVSPNIENVFGFITEEFTSGKIPYLEIISPEDIDRVANEVVLNSKSGEESFIHQPYRIITKNGNTIWVDDYTTILRNQQGDITHYLGYIVDITEFKLAEETALLSEKRFRDLFESISDLIYTHDLDGRFIDTNPAMQKLFGYDEDEFIGHRVADFMKLKFQFDFKSKYLDVIKKRGHHKGISCYLKKNKEKIYIEYQNSLIKPDDAEPYISGIGRDVTEKILSERNVKKLQKQVAQSQKMESIGTLAGGIAHDFNNILYPIVGHSEMLLADIPEESPFRRGISQIYTAALRASELVKQILTFSRQDNGELKLMKMQPIIKEALKLIRSTIPTTIDIKLSIQPDCGAIKADPTQIHQIIMNLATNAYHAMEENGGQLNIRLKKIVLKESDLFSSDIKPGMFACLSISDTGKGMDKELIEKIFDPFFTTKETGKGTGMGLSVVHGIIKSMDGSIKVYSEPGKGTEFLVYLPLAEAMKEQQPTTTKTYILGGTEHILLVDDEKEIIEMEQNMLERLGYKLTSRSSSLEALEAFKANPNKFDMVITDMAMPNMPGDKLSAELIKLRPDIPILLCTGFSETMSEEEAASLGIQGFLLKPIVMKDLSEKIREVLDDAKGSDQG